MIKYSLFTHKSAHKEKNEDAIFFCGKSIQSEDYFKSGRTFGRNVAFAVFDGVGGTDCGKMASLTCADLFGKFFRPSRVRSVTDIRDGFAMLQSGVLRLEEREGCSAMTTVVALVIHRQDVWICNVGDSPLFLESDGCFEEITLRDTYLNLLLEEKGFVSDEEKTKHAHRLSQCIGYKGFDKYKTHVYHFTLRHGMRFFLMTDGVSNYFSKEDLQRLFLSRDNFGDTVTFIRSEILRLGAEDDFSLIGVEVAK